MNKSFTPPKLATRLLHTFLRRDLAEEVSGDLTEKFELELQTKSFGKARLNYWYQVFAYLRPFAIRKIKAYPTNHYGMFKNYFKVSVRALWKSRGMSAINISGLATGMAFSLLIFLFVQDELRYDHYHQNSDRIYRVVKDFINDDGSRIPDATTPGPLAGAMQREIPEVEAITRIYPDWGGKITMEYGELTVAEPKVWMVDSSFFDVFTVTFLKGDPKSALSDVNSIVLTESTAKRYFGTDEPIGKTLKMNNNQDVFVTAVINDVPSQSHFHYDFLLSYRRLPPNAHTNWGSYNYYTYVKVRQGTIIPDFEKKIQDVHDRNTPEHYSAFYTQPLLDIHLTSKLKWELEPNGDILYVRIFIIIGAFIIIIAAINYINLSTAKSSLRAKETGIRKVSGAARTSLIAQFLLESTIICIISALAAVFITYTLLPFVNELTQKQLTLTSGASGLIYLGMITLFVGIIAGIFPAAYLSSFQPVAVLKGLKFNEKGTVGLRRALVVVQFTISISLIIGALIVVKQMNYIRTTNLGFDTDQVVVIRNAGKLTKAERSSFLNSIKELSGVEKASTSSTILGQGFSTTRLSAVGSQLQQQLNFSSVDFDFLDVIGMQMKEGRGFSREFPADTVNNKVREGTLHQRLGGIVINEQAAKDFGLGTPAVGKQLIWATDGDTTYYVDVVGVAKDFHFTSLRTSIKPYGFLIFPNWQSNFTIKISAANISSTISQLESLWKKNFPEVDFEYLFLDETFAKLYTSETNFQKVFTSLVVLGIVIACLGLYALATFSAEQRVKEIGIRKAMGASVSHIVLLLSKDFLKLVIVAIVFAIPVAAYGMQGWLQGFAYHTSIPWWTFALAAILSVLIAFLTISFQSVKAATTDPAKSLRSE